MNYAIRFWRNRVPRSCPAAPLFPLHVNISLRPVPLPENVRRDPFDRIAPQMEWLGLLLLFGFCAFLLGRRYTNRIDRIEAEKAAAAQGEAGSDDARHQ